MLKKKNSAFPRNILIVPEKEVTLFTVDVAVYFCGENTEFMSQISLLQILDRPLISDVALGKFLFFNFLIGNKDGTSPHGSDEG